MFKSLAVLVLLAGTAHGSDLSLTLRHRTLRSAPNLIDAYAAYEAPLLPWLDGEFAARLSLSTSAFEAADYKGEARAKPFSWLTLAARLYQSNRPAEGTGLTQWMLASTFHTGIFSFLGVAFTFGWQQRYLLIDGNVGLPVFFNADHTERDFAARLALWLVPTERWTTTVGLSTIEEFDAYNLNSPFAFLEVSHQPSDAKWTATAFARYRVLLGFGRRDEFVVGAGLKFPLTESL